MKTVTVSTRFPELRGPAATRVFTAKGEGTTIPAALRRATEALFDDAALKRKRISAFIMTVSVVNGDREEESEGEKPEKATSTSKPASLKPSDLCACGHPPHHESCTAPVHGSPCGCSSYFPAHYLKPK